MNEAIEISDDIWMQIFDNFIGKLAADLLDWVDKLVPLGQDLIL